MEKILDRMFIPYDSLEIYVCEKYAQRYLKIISDNKTYLISLEDLINFIQKT